MDVGERKFILYLKYLFLESLNRAAQRLGRMREWPPMSRQAVKIVHGFRTEIKRGEVTVRSAL
ncbi:MAG: hypothetical protein M0Z28_00705 [Rhodospirillales bacterium]|nr:hypothetical protein [Rhodospirillales bacterium]